MTRDLASSAGPSDALVVFGATGGLAHKQIFPALYAMHQGAQAFSSSWSSLLKHIAYKARALTQTGA